jgi:hypothetical protein
LAARFRHECIATALDGAPNHRSAERKVPRTIALIFLLPYRLEPNPKETIWDEMRKKIFKNFALKFMRKVEKKLCDAELYLWKNPDIVRSIAAFEDFTSAL